MHPNLDDGAFQALDRAVEQVLGERLIRPREVRPAGSAVPVWPTLAQARGKFLLILDEGGAKRDLYADDWQRRPMFVNVGPEHPGAAVMIVNDPVADFRRIQALVGSGYMVRTRADADTWEARSNDTQRRQAAFASGAQAIGSDYYRSTNPFPFMELQSLSGKTNFFEKRNSEYMKAGVTASRAYDVAEDF